MEELFYKMDTTMNNLFLDLMKCPKGTKEYEIMISELAELYNNFKTLLDMAHDGIDKPIYDFKYTNLELVEKTLEEYNSNNRKR